MTDLLQTPAPGERQVRFVGDTVVFTLRRAEGRPWPAGWRAFLRTNLGRADVARAETIDSVESGRPLPHACWRDIPLQREGEAWQCRIPLAEVGYFRAKAYAQDEKGWQQWPEGPDAGINVQPDFCRTGNIIYCAFTRMFGPTREARRTTDARLEARLKLLDERGYAVIPPSGKLRDLKRHLPHIFDTLGCRILHLLPVNPTPTTYARFGRFGSPYACQDLLAIDPALVEFDRRTTGLDQFRELADAVHEQGGRLFLDMVVNHTGWGSTLQERHSEWFVRGPDGTFKSPGAWGTIWEDLVELEPHHAGLRRQFGDVFLEWCRRGVDGFRCDAGYQVPLPVWQYVIARVRQEFPDTVFLLEGLGGAWEATESLLTDGGLQWAYSELFQNYDGLQVAGYLDHALRQSERVGLLVHYSETHDNERLAAQGRAWSLFRNRLSALTSVSGAFGFTCGVEWLAPERVNVHSSRGLAWGSQDNIVAELGQLNRLLAEHPCFFDGAQLTRLSEPESPIYALRRVSAEGRDAVLVLANTDLKSSRTIRLGEAALAPPGLAGPKLVDLLGQEPPEPKREASELVVSLPAASVFCLSTEARPQGLAGEPYRRRRAREALALSTLAHHLPIEQLGAVNVQWLGERLDENPAAYLSALTYLKSDTASEGVEAALTAAAASFPRVVVWHLPDQRRVVPIPPGHWFLVSAASPFRATLAAGAAAGVFPQHAVSLPTAQGQVACFPPRTAAAKARLSLDLCSGGTTRRVESIVRFLAATPAGVGEEAAPPTGVVLLTNGIGGMARLGVDLGSVQSKYDCLLGANLHPRVPVDRHVFAKRLRAWVNADGFISPLDAGNLLAFSPGPPAHWEFLAHAGDGRVVGIHLWAWMLAERNTVALRFHRVASEAPSRHALPAAADVRLTVRVDLEDRNFHAETKRTSGADHHFNTHCHPWPSSSPLSPRQPSTPPPHPQPTSSDHSFVCGFSLTPAADRQVRVWADAGQYHPQAEWCENIPHPIEQSRGQAGAGDAFSPGWFELPLPSGKTATIIVSADTGDPSAAELEQSLAGQVQLPLDCRPVAASGEGADAAGSSPASALAAVPLRGRPGSRSPGAPSGWAGRPVDHQENSPSPPSRPEDNTLIPTPDGSRSRSPAAAAAAFGERLAAAARAFVVRRDNAKTVIAGYPWFLDWGRDTLICARGLLAAGLRDTVIQLLQVFGRFEQHGTLPNTIHGEDASNRDTSDAPLWYGVVCEELAGEDPGLLLDLRVASGGRTIAEVLHSIAVHYVRGTPNGIRMDPDSALVWSPSHFTWMDTNHPAATPREGYPVEVQALWVRLLRYLDRLDLPTVAGSWGQLARRAQAALEAMFWLEPQGFLADVLLASPGQPAGSATPQQALRSNGLFAVALGVVGGDQARGTVEAARQHLLVPGALRSLAPLPVSPPLAIQGRDGRLLNDPHHPYRGRYEGDEDTCRKPSYHNGTAWVWTLPSFGEALVRAWDFAPAAIEAAKAYVGSVEALLDAGCLGHLPEIVDGDAPHTQRGCDAQAWSVTETLRVWRWLEDFWNDRSG